MNDERAEDRAAEGLEHLQAAALELIAAARAFLDVAEEVVREPAVAATIVSTAASVGRAVLHGPERRGTPGETAGDGATVRRIHVS